jgi:uncharacterized OsmC-like protein
MKLLPHHKEIHLRVSLAIAVADDTEKARKLIEKAEKACLIANSLKCSRTLKSSVEISERTELRTA